VSGPVTLQTLRTAPPSPRQDPERFLSTQAAAALESTLESSPAPNRAPASA